MKGRRKISMVSMLHYIRLFYRSVLLILLLISYIRFRTYNGETIMKNMEKYPAILYVIWAVFVVEMIMRFLPFRFESPGC